MRRRRWQVLAAGVALAAVAAGLFLAWPRLTGESDTSRVQGVWAGGGVRVAFDGDLAVMTWDEHPTVSRSYFRLDPSASPAQIAAFNADAPGASHPVQLLGVPLGRRSPGRPGDEYRGSYELRGDQLRLCLPLPGAKPPDGFDPAQGAVFELRRQ